MADRVTVHTDRMAHGGRAIGRVNGQVVFVTGAYPEETVEAEITGQGRRHLHTRATAIISPSPARIDPPCPHFGICGGCQWQSAAYGAQLEWKQQVVADQLAHLGRLTDVDVRPALAPGPEYRYRNRMDFKIVAGRPALLKLSSHEPVELDVCLVMADLLHPLFSHLAPPPGAERVSCEPASGPARRWSCSRTTTEPCTRWWTGPFSESPAGPSFRSTPAGRRCSSRW